MGCKVKACADCTKKCLLVHAKETSISPVISSFFKVMIGDRYSEVLFLPPKFAPTASSLIGEKALLEDSNRQQWEVTVSNLNGSVAFQQGWDAFALHHRLAIGDFVVFHYIMGSLFVVKIYGKTGCEKLDFSETRRPRKKSRITRNSTFKDGQTYATDSGSMNKQGSSTSAISGSDVQISQSQCEINDLEKAINKITTDSENNNGRLHSVSKPEYFEEPCYIIDRDLGDIRGEDRCPIFDLSYFEMLENNSVADKSNKIMVGGNGNNPYHADASLRSQIEDVVVNKDPANEEVVNRDMASDASGIVMMEKNKDFQKMDKKVAVSEKNSCNSKISEHLLSTAAVELQENGRNSSRANSSNEQFKSCHIAEEDNKAQSKSLSEIDQVMVSLKEHTSLADNNRSGQLEFTGNLRESNVLVATRMLNDIVEEEPVEMTPKSSSDEEMIQDIYGKLPQVMRAFCGQSSDVLVRENAIQLVKSENLNLPAISSPIATKISCEIASGGQPFLELPTCLPATSFTRRIGRERRVVLLRDPDMRVWPVLYHERSEFQLLTSGWEAFSKANNLQLGDACVFGVEKEDQGIYGVNIIRK